MADMENKITEMINLFTQVQQVMKKTADGVDDLTLHNRELKKSKAAILDVLKKNRKGYADFSKDLKAAKKHYSDLIKVDKEFKIALSRAESNSKDFRTQLGNVSTVLATVKTGIGKVTGVIGKLTGALGITGLSFGSVVKTGLEYNRALFEISRAQQVAGQGSDDLASALEYVAQKTVLSSQQFAELANVIQSAFVGLKPSLMETAKLVETIGTQLGYSFEAQKKGAQSLMGVLAKYPKVYQAVVDSSEKLKKAQAAGGGGVSKELAKELESKRASHEQTLQMIGATAQERDVALQMLTEKTAGQIKFMELEKEAAKATQAMDSAKLELFKTLQPMLLAATKQTTKLINSFVKYKELIIGVTVVVGGLMAANAAWNAVAKLNPYVAILAAVVAVGTAIYGIAKAQSRANAEQQKATEKAEIQATILGERQKLTKEQITLYGEEWRAVDKSNMSMEDKLKTHNEIVQSVTKQTTTSAKLSRAFDRIKADVGAELEIINKITSAMGTQVKIAQEFGMVNEKSMQTMRDTAEIALAATAKELTASIEAIKNSFQDEGIEVNLSGDLQSQAKQLQESGRLLKDGEARNEILKKTAFIMDSLGEYSKAEADVVRTSMEFHKRRITQQERSTSAYEKRLATERKLMESAQFGLGASVEMMQKQVNLAHEMMKTYAEADQQWQKDLMARGLVNEEQMKGIQNAKTQAEAESYIANVIKAEGKEQKELNAYAEEHQKIAEKTMEQQQKIYDLTKDIREGYLDAIREMAVGAGEFEKIIGTQEMGVTQLMTAVKDVTGVAKLNTMALGGLQEKVLTSKGVGTELTGQYTSQGLSFIGGQTQEERNARIWNYGKKREGRLGTGVAAGAESQYTRAIQQAGVQGTITADMLKSQTSGRSRVNVGVDRGAFSQKEVSGIRRGRGPAGPAAFIEGSLQGTKAPTPASGGFVGVPGGRLEPPLASMGGGEGRVMVTISLAPGLEGDITEASGAIAELKLAAS